MTIQTTTHKAEAKSKKRRSALLLGLGVGVALASAVALGGTARQADAAFATKIVFESDRTTGTGVNNPTGDYEIFKMNPDGTGVRQLTFNEVDEEIPILSPNGKKIAYESYGIQTSNPEGDDEVYVMNALDGSGKKNLTNNGSSVQDYYGDFSPDSTKVAYKSEGEQESNPEGDVEVYRVNALDGTGKKNLTDNGDGINDFSPVFSPGGKKIAYESNGSQTSNPEGDNEVYVMNALDGKGKDNLTHNGLGVYDTDPVFSPDGKKIAYVGSGIRTSNPQGDVEIYRMNVLDGTGKKNLTDNGDGINDRNPVFSPDGTKIAYESYGKQESNPEGEDEVYRMNTLDGSGKKNLSNNIVSSDLDPDWGVQAT